MFSLRAIGLLPALTCLEVSPQQKSSQNSQIKWTIWLSRHSLSQPSAEMNCLAEYLYNCCPGTAVNLAKLKWSFQVRKARHPPVTRSFSRCPGCTFQLTYQALNIMRKRQRSRTLSPTRPIIPNCVSLVVGSVGKPPTVCDTRCHSIVACCGK